MKSVMMSRGTALPVLSGRKPVSILCEISVLISMMSPRLAFAGALMRARAMVRLPRDRGKRDDNLRLAGPERAVAHFLQGNDLLRIPYADARRQRRPSGARPQV